MQWKVIESTPEKKYKMYRKSVALYGKKLSANWKLSCLLMLRYCWVTGPLNILQTAKSAQNVCCIIPASELKVNEMERLRATSLCIRLNEEVKACTSKITSFSTSAG